MKDTNREENNDAAMRSRMRRRTLPSIALVIFIAVILLIYDPLVNFIGEVLSFIVLFALCLLGVYIYRQNSSSLHGPRMEEMSASIADEIKIFGMKNFIIENAIFLGIPAGIAMFVLERYIFESSTGHSEPFLVALLLNSFFGVLFGIAMAYIQRRSSKKESGKLPESQ